MYPNKQAYAPTPHSYIPNTALSATVNLDEVRAFPSPLSGTNELTCTKEIKLATTRAERDLQDSLAEVFSIIITLDELEKAYLKDAIPEADYTEICDRLLKQYKAILTDETVAKEFVDLETFKYEWDVCIRDFSGQVLSIRLIILDGGTSGYREDTNRPPFHGYGTNSCSDKWEYRGQWKSDPGSDAGFHHILGCTQVGAACERSAPPAALGRNTVGQQSYRQRL